MDLTRRGALALGAGAVLAGVLPARASAITIEDRIADFTGGAEIGEGGITLETPEIAENGGSVPLSVAAPGSVAIMLLADGNPNPDVGLFTFGPLAARQAASTRIRLAGTQDVIAIAQMSDGSFVRATNHIQVTIGGCV